MISEFDEIEKAIAKEFDGSACDFSCRYKREGLSKSSRILLNWFIEENLSGKNLLDLGCGTGGFSLEALKNGALSCTGIDLSSSMVKAASELASEMDLGDRARFQEGNAALVDLPLADMIVLDKVLCCYPDVDPLLKNASSAQPSIVGFVVPRDEGLWKWPLRLAASAGNLLRQLRKHPLSWFYIHSLRTIDEKLVEAGFAKKRKRASRMWLVFLYKREGSFYSNPVPKHQS